jgi:hypothetical protein
MATRVFETPGGIAFAGFYYPEILRELLQDLRANKELLGLTDENEFEVHVQMLRAFAVVGHLNNARLDTAVTELLIDSAGLLESVRKLLRLMGVELAGAVPAVADLVMKLAEVTTIDLVDFIPDLSQFSTESVPPIPFEASAMDLDRTDQVKYVFGLRKTDSGTGSVDTTAPDVFRRDAGIWGSGPTDPVGSHLFLTDSDLFNGGEYRVTTRLNDTDVKVAKIPGSKVPGFLTETGITFVLRKFSADYATQANTPASTFQPWPTAPEVGDALYIGHRQMMWTQLDFILSGAAATSIGGVWEYFDNERTLLYPADVTDNGSTLTFDLTSLLGTKNAAGAEVTVVFAQTGAREVVTSIWNGSENVITTDGLLGQTTPSDSVTDYLVTADWIPCENTADGTDDGNGTFSQDGSISFELPQTRERSWLATDVNLLEAFWIRFRYTNQIAGAPTNPTQDEIDIDGGDQHVYRRVTQGETVGPQIVGSSTGLPDQEFWLPSTPYIDNSETIEVDEGGAGAWVEYRYAESFLESASTSRHYIREVNSDGRAKITFGDGERGKVPPAGIDNVRATYRTFGIAGDTVDGNVGADQITVNADGVNGISEVTNPRPAFGWRIKEGGTDADLNRVKRDKPAEFRTRNTASNPEDIEYHAVHTFVDSSGTKPVARAFAEEEKFGIKTVGLLVVGAGGAPLTADQLEELDLYFNGDRYARPPVKGIIQSNTRVTSVNFEPKLISVEATVVWKGGSAEAIRNRLLSFITPLTVEEEDGTTYVYSFGGQVSHSRVSSEIHAVDPAIRDVPELKLNGVDGSVTLVGEELPYTTASSIVINIEEA